MRWLRFFRRNQRDAECAREIQFHLDAETEDNLARGLSPEEARAAAQKKLGNRTLIREEIYRMNSRLFLENFWQDLRYALRGLGRNRVFTATAILTLALGIGGNTAMFTVIRAVLLKPLEYRDPSRLIYFSLDNPKRHVQDSTFSLERLKQMRASAHSYTALGAFLHTPETFTLSGGGEPESLKAARVSGNFLEILGVQPLLGRGFLPSEDTPGGRAVVMLSAPLWQRRFGGDPQIAGKTIALDSTPYTVIGVLPPGFSFPFAGMDVWVTKPAEWSWLAPKYWRGVTILLGFGRLKPNVSLEQARAELEVLNQRYVRSHPVMPFEKDARPRIELLKDRLVSNVRPTLWMLLGAVGFVLLIACANVAGLLMARSASRSRELAVRAALGAGRGRLIRQLLAESLLLAAAGGVIGILLAVWGLRIVAATKVLSVSPRISPLALPGAADLRLDGAVLGFTVLLAIAAGLVFGLFPSLRVSRPDLANALRDRAEGSGRGSAIGGIKARGVLVVGQVALSIVLLIGAALLMTSFVRLHNVNPGFEAADLLTMKVALPPARYDTSAKRAAFFRNLAQRVSAIPGVRSAAVAMSLPTTSWLGTNVRRRDQTQEESQSQTSQLQSVTPGYFHTLGVPLRRGREFVPRDNTPGAQPVVIVNESFARRFWPSYPAGENPVGQSILEGADSAAGWLEVVGIVADVREGGLAAEPKPEFYVPCTLHPPQTGYIVVRASDVPLAFANAVRSQVLAIDPDQPVSDIKTMEGVFDVQLGQRRLTMILLGGFAGVALLLAMIGLYGVIAYSVAQRTAELGIRRALGAQSGDILWLVMGRGLVLTLLGVALGVGGALALARLMKGFLFGIGATDPATFAGVALLFVLVSLAASFVPARRATRIDPMTALR